MICKVGTVISCVPEFWLALVLILVFSVSLRWLPSSGAYAVGRENNIMDRIVHMILPLTVIVTEHLWYYGYMIRNKMLDEIRAEYVLLANEKVPDHAFSLHEKYHAGVSKYYGNFCGTHYGWNVRGGNGFFLSWNRHTGI